MSPGLALLPALPLLVAALLATGGRRLDRTAGWIASITNGVALLVLAPLALDAFRGRPVIASGWSLLEMPTLAADVALRLDPLSAVLLLALLGLSLLVHLHAVAVCSEPAATRRLLWRLNLLLGLTVLVLTAENLLFLLLPWTGLSLAASLSVPGRRDGAGVRTLLTNLLGDAALLAAILLLARFTGRFDVATILGKARELAALPSPVAGIPFTRLDGIALLLFLGIAGKTAQFPLHGWFADSAGVATRAAFIQALSLPAAGVFLALRLEPLLTSAPVARELIIGLAVFTAFVAAVIALTQTDLLRLLSWAAMSRNGLILAGVVAGAAAGAMILHVMQMLFASILFLAAGFVVRAMRESAEIRSMGGLWRRLPFTFAAFLVGALGFLGVPFTQGFDATLVVVEAVMRRNSAAGALLVVTALVLAVAMARAVLTVFTGAERFGREISESCRETGGAVLLSIVMLVAGGYIIGHFALASSVPPLPGVRFAVPAAVLTGLVLGLIRYRRRTPHSTPLKEFIRSGFGWDGVVRVLLATPFTAAAVWSRDVVDRVGIDSVFEGLGAFGAGMGEAMGDFRSSRLAPALVILAIVVIVLVWVVAR